MQIRPSCALGPADAATPKWVLIMHRLWLYRYVYVALGACQPPDIYVQGGLSLVYMASWGAPLGVLGITFTFQEYILFYINGTLD